MASAILTAMFPTLYTVCDFRASHALGQKDFSSLRYYVAYLAACREMAARYGVSLRDFDRANWQWSKDQTKKKMKKCSFSTLLAQTVSSVWVPLANARRKLYGNCAKTVLDPGGC
jgi:hypothetical protein